MYPYIHAYVQYGYYMGRGRFLAELTALHVHVQLYVHYVASSAALSLRYWRGGMR